MPGGAVLTADCWPEGWGSRTPNLERAKVTRSNASIVRRGLEFGSDDFNLDTPIRLQTRD
jgi:hypothetical protein